MEIYNNWYSQFYPPLGYVIFHVKPVFRSSSVERICELMWESKETCILYRILQYFILQRCNEVIVDNILKNKLDVPSCADPAIFFFHFVSLSHVILDFCTTAVAQNWNITQESTESHGALRANSVEFPGEMQALGTTRHQSGWHQTDGTTSGQTHVCDVDKLPNVTPHWCPMGSHR